ncbi:hypothetical protein LCGC14_2023760, partial [marine sediment metagenome]
TNKVTRWFRHLFTTPTAPRPRSKRKIIIAVDTTTKPTAKAYLSLSTVWQNILSAEERVSIGQDICISFLGVEKGRLVFKHLIGSYS